MDLLYIFLVMIIAITIYHIISEYFNNNYLILKSKKDNRTAICIRDKFYYIVPEDEYIQLDLIRLRYDSEKKPKAVNLNGPT